MAGTVRESMPELLTLQTACRLGLTALASGLLLGAADVPTGGDPSVRVLVIPNLYFAGPGEEGSCKSVSDGGLETYFKMLSAEDQAQYATPDRRQALEQSMNRHFGFRRLALRQRSGGGRTEQAMLPPGLKPGVTPTPEQAFEIGQLNGFPKDRGRLAFLNQTVDYNSCTNPEDFPALASGYRTYDGRQAVGIDLDGKVRPDDFISPSGTPGVDNQLWRAIGCTKVFKEHGDARIARGAFLSANAPTLIEITAIDDSRNDSDVTVNVYAGAEAITRDGRGNALAWASFRVDNNPALRATTHGRIVDGVLTTDPVNLRLNYKEQIVDAPRVILGARIQAVLKPDGSADGHIFGYYTLDSFYQSIEMMTQNGANLSGLSCPGVRQAIDRLADGYRNPRTRRYTAISSTVGFFAVPAFIVDEPGPAARETQRATSGKSL